MTSVYDRSLDVVPAGREWCTVDDRGLVRHIAPWAPTSSRRNRPTRLLRRQQHGLEELLGVEVAPGGGLDVGRGHPRDHLARIEDERRVVAVGVRRAQPADPEAVVAQLDLALAAERLLDLLEIVRADAGLLDSGDLVEGGVDQLGDAQRIAAERDREVALLVRRAADGAADPDAVDAALVLAQHLAQPDLHDLAEDVQVAIAVARPGLVAVEQDLDPRLGLLAEHPGLLDHAADLANPEVLLLLVAPLRRQARQVGLDQRPEPRRVARTDDDEGEVGRVAEAILVEREGLGGVELVDVGRADRLAPRVAVPQHRLRLDRELDLRVAQPVDQLLPGVLAPHRDRAVVLARRRHAQIDELEHGLEVADRRAGLETMFQLVYLR